MNKRNPIIQTISRFTGLVVFLLSSLALTGAGVEAPSLFDQLGHEEVLKVRLEMDLAAVLGNRRNTDSHPAVFSYKDAEGALQRWDTKVKLRGKFRRVKCAAMPPLKLNFKKKDLAMAGLAPFDDFKLVTHCVSDDRLARDLLLREYLAYRLYNELTEESYRVQFLQITYVDSRSGSKDLQWGFLIEDTAQLRARLGAEKWKNPMGIDSSYFRAAQLQRVALFQHLIGNVDWSIRSARNVKILQREGMALVVPYDFDFSAFVGAPYRSVDQYFSADGVTGEHQAYLTSVADKNSLEPAWSHFLAQKEALLRTIKSCKAMRPSERRAATDFVEAFFERMEDREDLVLR
ncbi:MAG: hypothetical protein AAFW73_13510 [Bacteroidota bacterium]